MLLISDVYKLLLDSLRIDLRGLSVEPDEFSRLIRLVNQEIFDSYINTFEEDADSSDDLSFLKVHDYSITLIALPSRGLAYGTMPTNYYRVIGRPWTLDSNSVKRYVDLVTSLEDTSREDNYLKKASTTFPTARIGGVNGAGQIQIKVRPQTITTVYVSYLRSVAVPFLDYYTNNTTLVKTFLPDTATLQTVPIGCTYRDGTAGSGTAITASQTADLEWGEGDLALVLSKMIQRIGATLPDEGLVRTGLADEIKIQG